MRTILILAAVLLIGCTSQGDAMRALEGAGYSEINVTGWRPFSCSSGDGGDQFATGFEAKGPTGKKVSGAVCSGILKGATIRTD